MRVAVVGATGNVGSAVLEALEAAPEVSSVLGIARRLPDRSAPPYRSADWVTVDIGAQAADEAAEEALIAELVDALQGVDAVVHLAWLIQPNHDRELMRRTNVTGTARVAQACARAGVGQLVCASSWAVYSPVDDDAPRDEGWLRGGIRSSHYSVDKAAQEEVLDRFEETHPEVVVTRMRTALVFTADAGAEIVRYFLGPLIPLSLLRPGVLPVLPLPSGLRLHVVHAQDVGQAYLLAVLQRAGGAFNVAADEVLWPDDLARILDHGRYVEISPRLIRPLLHLAWSARLVASDAGWLDMAMGVPLMDSSRVRRVLGWQPRHGAEEALRDLLDGMVGRRGRVSAPLRPRDTAYEGPPGPRGDRLRRRNQRAASANAATADTTTGETMAGQVPPQIERDLLSLYLSDHLTGATAGLSRIERMADAYGDGELGPDLQRIAADIREERTLLRDLVDELGLRQRPHRHALAWLAEHAGRLKLNKRLLSTSPMSVVLELELMRSAVIGKLGGWQTLTELAPELDLDRARFETLAERAKDQAATLERLHAQVRGPAFHVGQAPH